MRHNALYTLMMVFVLAACVKPVENAELLNEKPMIYPDYTDVTIPVGIAPMNFNIMDDDVSCLDVSVKGSKGGELHVQGDYADFDVEEWHSLVNQNKGGELVFTVCVEKSGKWYQYNDFKMYVSKYALDEWGLTYRRVAPGYEVYSQMGLYQRDLSTFEEYEIMQNTRTSGSCVNCHTSNRTNPKEFLFHVRGEHGATVIQKDGNVDFLDTKTDKTIGLCVYPYWHPDGRYIAFSTNTTRQGFHVVKGERIEVFDNESDLQVLDTKTNELILSPVFTKKEFNETYPSFSPDGKTMYFCSTVLREYPANMRNVRYNLCSISFDADNASFGERIDTLVDAESDSVSIAFPKPSYDGKYIMYTLANYGTFPIWHKEADLWLLNLKTGERRALNEVNSNDTESYHNWSDNSHWFVFSSRRGDGLYTRLYISSIDEEGRATKPFLLPQKNPKHYYDRLMYSYNVPDFTKEKVDIDSWKTANGILSEKRTSLSVHQ